MELRKNELMAQYEVADKEFKAIDVKLSALGFDVMSEGLQELSAQWKIALNARQAIQDQITAINNAEIFAR